MARLRRPAAPLTRGSAPRRAARRGARVERQRAPCRRRARSRIDARCVNGVCSRASTRVASAALRIDARCVNGVAHRRALRQRCLEDDASMRVNRMLRPCSDRAVPLCASSYCASSYCASSRFASVTATRSGSRWCSTSLGPSPSPRLLSLFGIRNLGRLQQPVTTPAAPQQKRASRHDPRLELGRRIAQGTLVGCVVNPRWIPAVEPVSGAHGVAKGERQPGTLDVSVAAIIVEHVRERAPHLERSPQGSRVKAVLENPP